MSCPEEKDEGQMIMNERKRKKGRSFKGEGMISYLEEDGEEEGDVQRERQGENDGGGTKGKEIVVI